MDFDFIYYPQFLVLQDIQGNQYDLTPTEHYLIEVLIENRVVNSQRLIKKLDTTESGIVSAISRIRKKTGIKIIKKTNYGYRLLSIIKKGE